MHILKLAKVFGATLGLIAVFAVAPANAQVADTSLIAKEATQWLADLIRINTTNPPGNEAAAANYIAGILKREGIPSEILELAPGRSAVVARLASSAMADPTRALLLDAHMDVVGVDRAKWTVDPFGAVQKDGYLYGRGAVDDKGMLAANLAAFVALKRMNMRLGRDVIFLATCDEEQGGGASIKELAAKYWNKIAAGYALNEGGNVYAKDGKVFYVAVQASEKVSVNVAVTAKGRSYHASQPTPDNAVVHLASAIAKIGEYSAPAQPTTIVLRYFEEMARIEEPETAKWMRALDTPDRGDHAQRYLSRQSPLWNSMLRDSISPTILSAGVRVNVIPAEARAEMNIRLLPGNSVQALLAELTKLVNDPQIKFEVLDDAGVPAPSSRLDNDFYALIEKAGAEQFPGVPVLPYLSTWATDSSILRLRNVQAYGLVPFPLEDEDIRRMHGEDERMPVASFAQGVQFLYRIVSEFAAAK
jgi:acetylornithine deacetylase/succinyl-diaminopimelate desuccinylase-like protein